MRKLRLTLKIFIFTLLLSVLSSSCGLILGGRITSCQTAKPLFGKREIRVGYLVADILILPFITLPVDFKSGAIYKPCTHAKKKNRFPKQG